MKRSILVINLLIILFIGLLTRAIPTTAEHKGYDSCVSVRRMMTGDEPVLPYVSDIYDMQGKFLKGDEGKETHSFSGLTAEGAKTDSASPLYAYVFLLYSTEGTLNLSFEAPDLPLEYALFQGALAQANSDASNYSAFETISAFQDISIQILEADFYTLVVRRSNMDQINAGNFKLNAVFNSDSTIKPDEIGSEGWFNNRNSDHPIAYEPAWNTTEISTNAGSQTIQANAGSFYRIIRAGAVHQLLFRSGDSYESQMHFGGWVQDASIIGGSLAVKGERYLFLSDFVPELPEGDDNDSTQGDSDIGNGTLKRIHNKYGTLDTDWIDIKGIWVVDHCLGVLFTDGHTFIASLPDDKPYDISLKGGLSNFIAQLEIPNAVGDDIETLNLELDWSKIAPNHEVNIHSATLSSYLATGQAIELETTNIKIKIFQTENADSRSLTQILLDTSLNVLLDGQTLNAFYYRPSESQIELIFNDSRSPGSGSNPSRDTQNLVLFESFDGAIRLKYDDGQGNAKERLWLSEDYGYIELQTPERATNYNPRALPNEDGYIPTGLNNLGNECYTASTLIEDIACVHDTMVNYANGNLWYAVTDLQAYGGLIDLMLTRSYNSYNFGQDGPFGYGWTNEFLLDYKENYDSNKAAREITPDVIAEYRVGLNVLFAPHGYVMYQTPSGSQHLFERETDVDEADDLGMDIFRTKTMPNWVLMRRGETERERVRASWILRQEQGFTIEFDTAGRIQWYGYPAEQYPYDSADSRYLTEGRIVQIQYEGNLLNGATGQKVLISDNIAYRQLELQFDENYHVTSATLRDTTQANQESCSAENNCQQVNYTYENGRLTGVNYADGTSAKYTYPDGRLLSINDPRSPFTQELEISYQGDSKSPRVAGIHYKDSGETLPWINIEYNDGRVKVTKGDGESDSEYQYCINSCERNEFYTLRMYRNPLANEVGETAYRYSQETNRLAEIVTDSRGNRSSLREPSRISAVFELDGSFAPFRMDMELSNVQDFLKIFSNKDLATIPVPVLEQQNYLRTFRPTNINVGDGTTFQIDYRENHIIHIKDNAGATYVFEPNLANYNEITKVSLYSPLQNPDDPLVFPELHWEFQYNDIGLVSQVTRYAGNEPQDQGYIIRYQWDSLGQLTAITQNAASETPDKQVTIKRFVRFLERSYTEIHISDELATTVYCFDERSRLVDEVLVKGQVDELTCTGIFGRFEQRTSYYYDVLDRLVQERTWTGNIDQPELITRYDYQPVRTLTKIGNSPASDIFGYQIIVTEPEVDGKVQGRTIYIYDALNRLREVRDVFSHVTRYDYDYSKVGTDYYNGNGANRPHIIQYDFWDNNLVSTTDYFFDGKNRLQHLIRTDASDTQRQIEWQFRTIQDGDAVHLTDMNMGAYPVNTIHWTREANNISLVIPQARAGNGVNPEVAITYDYLQRPTLYQYSRQNGELVEQIIYCSLDNGYREEIYRNRSSLSGSISLDNDCNTSNFDKRIQFDGQNRIKHIEYSDGRSFSYSYTIENSETLVTLNDTSPDAPSKATTYRYNAAGYLVEWTDSSGIKYTYDVDALGRLLSVKVTQEDESTQEDKILENLSYTYNEAHQVTREQDNLTESTTTYFYNQQGLLTSIRDNTGNVTTYAYDRFGRLTTVITPLGRTISYSYNEDFLDIHRPVEMIIGGVSYQLDWQNRENCLLVTDPQGYTMAYIYDMVGLLRQVGYIDDDSENSNARKNCADHEVLATLTYDHSGILNGWYVGENIAESERAFAIATDSENGISVSAASGTDRLWKWSTQYDSEGNLQQVGNDSLRVDFGYDIYNRLNQIIPLSTAGEPLFWQISYEKGASLSYTNSQNNNFTITYDNHFNWLQSDELGIEYEYIGVYDKDIVYRFEQEGVEYVYQRLQSSPDDNQYRIVYLHSPGQSRQYLFDVEGHLVGITTQICAISDQKELPEVRDLDPYPCDKWNPDAELSSVPDEDRDDLRQVWETNTVIEFNAQGLPFRISENDLVETFAYDALGNITLYQDTSGRTFRYRYDQHNRLIRLESPANLVIVLEYGADERPIAICLSDNFEASSSDDRRDCLETSNGWLESYSYDTLGRPSSRTYPVFAGSQTVNSIDYDYDDNLRSGKPNSVGSLDFEYENILGRLRSINVTGVNDSNYTFGYWGLNDLREINQSQGETVTQRGTDTDSLKFYLGSSIVADIQYIQTLNSLQILRDGEKLQEMHLNDGGFVDLIEILNQGQLELDYSVSRTKTGVPRLQSDIDRVEGLARNEFITYQSDSHQQITTVQNINEFVLNYSLTSTGQVQTQRVLLTNSDQGYTFQMGYDEVGRPLTMQITDSTTGKPLYLLSLSHDNFGRIVRETRQYLLDTQNKLVEIRYNYDNNPSQLSSSEIRVREISNDLQIQQGASYILIPLILLGFYYSYRRRSRLILILAFVGTLGAATFLVGAQDITEASSFIFNYSYDQSGNLSKITHEDQTCASYQYDTANRLVRAERQGASSDYRYTANNNLERIDDFFLLYNSDQQTPIMAYDRRDSSLRLMANLSLELPLYQQNLDSGDLNTFYNNGLGEILADITESDNGEPITRASDLWLFDPLGRLVSLEWIDSDPCNLFTIDTTKLNELMPQITFNGMIWDSEINLMFDGAQSYDPIIGRFLQRNPTGPDVMGNTYTYYPAPPEPVLARRSDTMFEGGLQLLQKFQTDATITQSLSSAAIWQRHAPIPIGYHTDSFYQDFTASSQHVQNEVQNVLALSEGLLSHFRPQAQVDSDGTIRFYNPVAANNPQTATTRSFISPAAVGQGWMPSRPQSATASIESALSLLDYANYRFRITEPQAWRPQSFGLDNIWIEPRPNLSYTPDVTDWLLQPIDEPLMGLQTLQATEMISEFPNHDATWWIERALEAALPAFPELLPNSVEEWREGWFDSDVLGNTAIYETAWPDLDYPAIPNYNWGANWNGPDPDIDH